MNVSLERILSALNLDSYSSSEGWLGYSERTCRFQEAICQHAIDLFTSAFGNGACRLCVLSSLFIEARAYRGVRASLDCLISHPCDTWCGDSGILKLIDYDQLHVQMPVEGQYFQYVDSLHQNISLYPDVEIALCQQALRAVMAVDGVKGHFFVVLPEWRLIVYPHDDTGYGFITFEDASSAELVPFLRKHFAIAPFRFVLSKKYAAE